MLKKTLLAMAIASIAGSAAAADLVAPTAGGDATLTVAKAVSVEGNKLATTIVGAPIVATLEAEYKEGDTVTFTFAGAKIDPDQLPNSIVIPGVPGNLADETADGSADVGATEHKNQYKMTFGLLNKTDSDVTYRVTKIEDASGANANVGSTTIGIQLGLGATINRVAVPANSSPYDETANTVVLGTSVGLTYDAASFTGTKATVTYKAVTDNSLVFDSGKYTTATILEGKSQLSGTVTNGFDGVIDVNTSRYSFVEAADESAGAGAGDKTKTIDVLKFELKDADATDSYANSVDVLDDVTEVTVHGDFSFLDTDADKEGIQLAAGAVNVASAGYVADSLKVTADALTYKVAAFKAAASEEVVEIDVVGKEAGKSDVVIPTQEFTVTAEVPYALDADGTKKGTATVLNKVAAGSWKLNGALVHVPYMPFRPTTSPIVNISNTSKQDGDIEVVVYSADNAWAAPKSYMLPKAAKAESQTNITSVLQAAGISGDVAFDIIVNAPAKDIAVNALYYSAGDRAVINTVDRSAN